MWLTLESHETVAAGIRMYGLQSFGIQASFRFSGARPQVLNQAIQDISKKEIVSQSMNCPFCYQAMRKTNCSSPKSCEYERRTPKRGISSEPGANCKVWKFMLTDFGT